MARTTTNYGFNISEGTDMVNPLTDIFPNFEDIDTDLKAVSDEAVGNATELLTGTVHALTRSDSDRDVIRFTATANFTAGETFTVDGAQVTALTPDGQTLATGSYIIGSEVLAILKGTLLTVYVSPAKAKDADLLDGHDSSYFATSSDLTTLDGVVTNISDKVGSGVLDTTAHNCVGAINELNANLNDKENKLTQGTYTGYLSNIAPSGLKVNSVVWCDKSTVPDAPSAYGICLSLESASSIYVQLFFGVDGKSYFRIFVNLEWGQWVALN